MSLLVLQIPPRPRQSAAASLEFDYVLSLDGQGIGTTGRVPAALLPRATRTVAVLADADLAWHRVTLPKAPPARLRAALVGLMEDLLLDDEATLHFAVGAQGGAGQPAWVAVMHRPWLQSTLAALQAAGVECDALRPSSVPGEAVQGHFQSTGGGDGEAALHCVLSGPEGVTALPLAGTLSRALLTQAASAGTTRWTATPAAADAAERWLGVPLAVRTDAERLLDAAAGSVELRQFDLTPRHRGTRALREALLGLASPAWRPVRFGLAAVLALNLVGLNAWAWQQQRTLQTRQAAANELLRSAHPQVRAVLDAPLQMERETAGLRAAAGQIGDGDLEAMLAAAALAWPAGSAPAATLRFEPGRLTLGAPGWTEAQRTQWRERLQADGWNASTEDGRVTLARGAGR